MKTTAAERRQEALQRAVNPIGPWTNYPAILQGFVARGIPESEIKPRENVFTYEAWKALGRQVRRGEHGVKVVTFIPCESKGRSKEQTEQTETPGEVRKPKTYTRPWTTTVFHVSQTDPIQPRQTVNQPDGQLFAVGA